MRSPYPRYKPSGVEWLGDVPEHWEVKRLGHALSDTVGGGTPSTADDTYWADSDEEGIPWVAIADMSAGGEITTTTKRITPLGYAATQLRQLPPRTIIYSMYASVGAVARLGISATTNQAILGLLPSKRLDSSYLYWWLNGIQTIVLAMTRDNTQSNLSAETVCKIPLAVPPISEQRAIAGFLDRETARVDALVTKKQQLIERLAEYRKALITQTVTKGLPSDVAAAEGFDPSPQLKPSGVEWLGDVPEHWEVKRLCRSVNRSNIKVEPKEAEKSIYIGLEHVTSWTGQLLAIDDQKEPESLCNSFITGTVLFSKLGPYLAKAISADFDGVCSTEFLVLAPVKYEQHYLHFLLLTEGFISLVDSSTFGATRPRTSWDFVGSVHLPIPPLSEQRAITSFLDRETERIDALSGQVEAAIKRLQEYRKALITAAVTGKIDVSDWKSVDKRVTLNDDLSK